MHEGQMPHHKFAKTARSTKAREISLKKKKFMEAKAKLNLQMGDASPQNIAKWMAEAKKHEIKCDDDELCQEKAQRGNHLLPPVKTPKQRDPAIQSGNVVLKNQFQKLKLSIDKPRNVKPSISKFTTEFN